MKNHRTIECSNRIINKLHFSSVLEAFAPKKITLLYKNPERWKNYVMWLSPLCFFSKTQNTEN